MTRHSTRELILESEFAEMRLSNHSLTMAVRRRTSLIGSHYSQIFWTPSIGLGTFLFHSLLVELREAFTFPNVKGLLITSVRLDCHFFSNFQEKASLIESLKKDLKLTRAFFFYLLNGISFLPFSLPFFLKEVPTPFLKKSFNADFASLSFLRTPSPVCSTFSSCN